MHSETRSIARDASSATVPSSNVILAEIGSHAGLVNGYSSYHWEATPLAAPACDDRAKPASSSDRLIASCDDSYAGLPASRQPWDIASTVCIARSGENSFASTV